MSNILNQKTGTSHPIANITLDYAQVIIALVVLVLLLVSIDRMVDLVSLIRDIFGPNTLPCGP